MSRGSRTVDVEVEDGGDGQEESEQVEREKPRPMRDGSGNQLLVRGLCPPSSCRLDVSVAGAVDTFERGKRLIDGLELAPYPLTWLSIVLSCRNPVRDTCPASADRAS